MDEKYESIVCELKDELAGAAHHLDHTMRVLHNAVSISEGDDGVNLDVLVPACLLHDVGRKKEDEDTTGLVDHAVVGTEMAESILIKLGFDMQLIDAIKHCIRAHRFRKDHEKPSSKEAKILFDADKIDLTGAMGIARMFMIAGQFNQRILGCVDIDRYCTENLSQGRQDGRIIDMSKHSPTIEFETKIKKLQERLFTERGRSLAQKRIAFMADFFSRLATETNYQTT